MASTTKRPNTCQYWVDEPLVCIYWDATRATGTTISGCTFSELEENEGKAGPTKAPECNYIGTYDSCSCYKSSGEEGATEARCILPDRKRNAGRRTQPGGLYWQIDWINGYNDGKCDDSGTDTSCSGYSPYHMAFSTIAPDTTTTGVADIDSYSVVTSGLDYRVPLYHDVAYARAQLSRCWWWRENPTPFTIDAHTGKIDSIVNGCAYDRDIAIQKYWEDHHYDEDLGMWSAPCDGAKPECPHYTGVCWEYCIDEKMRQGDKVLAEQLLELRYYLFRENWNPTLYKDSFAQPELKAWAGNPIHMQENPTARAINYIIDAWRVYIDDFTYFHVDRDWTPLSAGTPANNYDGDYPDLVKAIKSLPLKPIIRNSFDILPGTETTTTSGYVFETGDINHENILIYGETFWFGSQIYAINLDDPELAFLPKNELLQYGSMREMKNAWAASSGTINDRYSKFYDELERSLEFVLTAFPEKAPATEIEGINAFFINANTFWGDNHIVVFDKGSGTWEYDKIYVRKIFVGGVIEQTSFDITGAGTVNYLPSYQDDFVAYHNNNGTITFDVVPLISYKRGDYSPVAYVYNDAVRERIPGTNLVEPTFNTYVLNYKLYKITLGEDIILSIGAGLKVLGNAGYIVCTLNDPDFILSNVIKPWEIEGDIYLTYPDETTLKMVVVEKGTDRLPINQFIIKPEDITKFKSVCNGSFILIDAVHTYEKHSFGDNMYSEKYSIAEVNDSFITEDDEVIDRSALSELSIENYTNFTLSKFGQDQLMISVVLRGPTGRMVGHIKTKLITWIRQPYCRDVEIYYDWTASYNEYQLEPHIFNYGPIDKTYKIDPETGQNIVIKISYSPPCGDHDLGHFTGEGAMWYPYGDCDDVARYRIITQFTENDTSIMEVFTDEEKYGAHGAWDMRMLGPDNNYGRTCDVHSSIWLCRFDWSYCNREKIGSDQSSSNVFSGYCRYRGGLDVIAKERALRDYGSLPKFGNVYRDFLRSYRAIDNIDYYVLNEAESLYLRKSKWVPANEFYTDLDMGINTADYLYKTYSSSDYYRDQSYFVNPFGSFLVFGSIEGVFINEQLDTSASGILNRYRFEEIFNTHSTVAGIYYPYPKTPYFKMVGGLPVTIITWYTYKDCPGKDISYSIQWAWREKWIDIAREKVIKSEEALPSTYIGSHRILDESCAAFEIYTNPIYNNAGDVLTGRHLFLDVLYPEYKYDYMLGEHRLVSDEGVQQLAITPSVSGSYWTIQLNSGPMRCFDETGEWVVGASGTEEGAYQALYDTCTTTPWIDDVTLFDTGYTSTTPSEEREIILYDGEGEEYSNYYQRGLAVEVLDSKFSYLPYTYKLITPEEFKYSVTFDSVPDCMGAYNDSPWGAIIAEEPHPNTEFCYNVEYCCSNIGDDTTLSLKYDMQPEDNSEPFNKTITAAVITFRYGKAPAEEQIPGVVYIGNLYHLPGIKVYCSNDGVSWTLTYSNNSMSLSTRYNKSVQDVTAFYDFEINPKEYRTGYRYLKISLRLSPTQTELDEAGDLKTYWELSGNIIGLQCVRLYYGNLESAVETVNSYERKYNISYGNHGDVAPHGNLLTGSLLYVMQHERSTVYQMDYAEGMVGMDPSFGNLKSMNKVRGRIMKGCHEDKERVPYSTVEKFEGEQVKIHNEIAIDSGATDFSLRSFSPPSLVAELDKLGLSYPSWSCNFLNTVVRPLTPINNYDMYSPCGHLFDWDFTTLKKTVCGPGNIQNTFEYKWINACTGGTLGWMTDAIVTYYNGMGTVLYNNFYFTQYSNAYISSTAWTTYSTQADTQTMTIPPQVLPIY